MDVNISDVNCETLELVGYHALFCRYLDDLWAFAEMLAELEHFVAEIGVEVAMPHAITSIVRLVGGAGAGATRSVTVVLLSDVAVSRTSRLTAYCPGIVAVPEIVPAGE